MSFEFIWTPENLRQEELIVQITEHLQLINSYSETLFKKIENKLNNIDSELNQINYRSEICSTKISQLKNEKKAITLYSHSKFPTGEINLKEFYQCLVIDDQFEQIFPKQKQQQQSEENVHCKPIINSTQIPYDDDSKLKSQFYIYDKQINRHSIPDHLNESHIPWQHLSSVGSLLLFNSSENAYALFDNQINSQTKSKQKIKSKDDHNENNVDNEDLLLIQNDNQKKNSDFNLTFHSAPEILHDLPPELPSLPGIADEFKFEDSNEIDLVDVSQLVLPDLAILSKTNSNIAPSPTFKSNDSLSSSSSSNLILVDKLPKISISDNELPSTLMPPPGIPPPPPPPPPPPVSPPEAKQLIETVNKPLPDNSRASLLESIRAAGGKPKPKTIKERKHDEKLKKKDEKEEERVMNGSEGVTNSSSGGMDMMAELRKRLESRRSGISNDQIIKETSTTKTSTSGKLNPNSPFTNISAMIPPPVNSDDNDELAEDDDAFEDWD